MIEFYFEFNSQLWPILSAHGTSTVNADIDIKEANSIYKAKKAIKKFCLTFPI